MITIILLWFSPVVAEGILPSKVPIGWLYLPAVGGANMSAYAPFSLAKKKLHEDGVLQRNVELDIRWYYFECDAYNGSVGFIDLVKLHNVTGLIGPPCSMTGDVIGRLAVSWNTLLISQKIESSKFTDKTLYQTLARTVLTSTSQMSGALATIITKFKWKRVALLSKPGYHNDLLHEGVIQAFESNLITLAADIVYKVQASKEELDSYLLQIRQTARIVVLIVSWSFDGTEEIMIQALRNNMTGPDYVWFICRLEVPIDGKVPWWDTNTTSAEELKQAYQQTISIYPSAYDPDKLRPFRELVRKEYYELYPERSADSYEFTQLQAALFDSLYTYGYVLNLSLTVGVSYKDGKGLFNLLKLKRIKGATAPVIFDINVERAPTYTVEAFDENGDWKMAIDVERELNLFTQKYDFILEFPRKMSWDTPNGLPPLDTPECGFDGALCVQVDHTNIYIAVAASFFALVLLVLLGYLYRNHMNERELMAMNWQIDHNKLLVDINEVRAYSRNTAGSGSIANVSANGSLPTVKKSIGSRHQNNHNGLLCAVYGDSRCHVFKYKTEKEVRLTREQLKILKSLKSLNHENLGYFVGMSIVSREEMIVMWGCSSHRTLKDLVENEDMTLDNDFLATFLRGALEGLYYIHRSPLSVHGNLTSLSCAVDSRFVIKMSEHGITQLQSQLAKDGVIKINKKAYELYHYAPEVIEDMATGRSSGTKAADIYSLGMIFYQIISRKHLYYDYIGTEDSLLARVKDSKKLPMVPTFPDDISVNWLGVISLIKQCWSHDPSIRPTIDMVKSVISNATSQFHGNIIEKMIRRMERYTTDLEKVVSERTAEVHAQQEMAQRLLHQMLPKSVADRLQAGIAVQPENFKSATILFTDIVGFTTMSSEHSAIEIISLLNELYSNFDQLIDKQNVYKVETIGDSYMVVSGLPRRTREHAFEIATLGLALIDYVRSFTMPFNDSGPLEIRVGAHSGSVVTGVVGLKMPRYCLFGDTVNTASRMESHGLPMRFHVTQENAKLLALYPEFDTVFRGTMEIKGKGMLATYFVERKPLIPD